MSNALLSSIVTQGIGTALIETASLISVNNVHAIVAPAPCLGGIPALAADFHDIPLIAVRENTTILDVTNAKMGMRNVIEVETPIWRRPAFTRAQKGHLP